MLFYIGLKEKIKILFYSDQLIIQVYQASACIPVRGCFYPPTIITNVQTVSKVVAEEVNRSDWYTTLFLYVITWDKF